MSNLDRKAFYFHSNFTEFCPAGAIHIKPGVAWRQICDMSLPRAMLARFTDAYTHHYASEIRVNQKHKSPFGTVGQPQQNQAQQNIMHILRDLLYERITPGQGQFY